MRRSYVVYILVRLASPEGGWLLLRRHEKWGDWSLVGGHVESWEMDDWSAAAAREAREELDPLREGKDFAIRPIQSSPISWGPEPSRSARGERTVYHVQYYTLAFLNEPIQLLSQLPSKDFLLIPENTIRSSPHALGRPVYMAHQIFANGLASAPLAWQEALNTKDLPAGLYVK